MTASTRLIDEFPFESAPDHASPLDVAREILGQVRYPDAIFLQRVEYEAAAGRALGQFLCPRSDQFPNPNLRELTGGQLIDSATQMAYCLTGLMIHAGVDLLGLDFEDFKREIRAHRVQAVRTDIAFRHPCNVDRPFSISANLKRFRNGELTVRRRNPPRYFVEIELEGRQQSSDLGGASAGIFRARIAACHRSR